MVRHGLAKHFLSTSHTPEMLTPWSDFTTSVSCLLTFLRYRVSSRCWTDQTRTVGDDHALANIARAELTSTVEAVPRAFNGAQVRSGMPPPPRRPQRPDESRERQIRGPPRAPENLANRQHRPRRASESSVMEKERRPRMERDDMRERTESSERRRRERRAEREERHRREKEKSRNGEKNSNSSRTKKPRGLDIIDKLDVTGIYGQGRK